MRERLNLFLRVTEVFENHGYRLSEACVLSNSCFDFFARRGERLLLVKVLGNIDSLTETQAGEISRVAATLEAAPVVVGCRRGVEKLQRGVVYLRHGIACVSELTLEQALAGEHPALLCYRGGYYASVDGEQLRRLRQAHGLSRPALAKLVGVSAKAIYKYEEGEAGATFETALKLERVLGEPLVKPVDIFRVPGAGQSPAPPARLERLCRLGFEVLPVRKAPFSALTRGEGRVLLTKLAKCRTRDVEERARLLRSISATVGKRAFILLGSGRARNISGIAAVSLREVEEIARARELLELIEERATPSQDAGG
ncbi:transcriptional regulator [Candidatus Pyrohabitans sp.]